MKAAIQAGMLSQRALGRSSPVLHVHPSLGTDSGLPPSSAYSLLSDQPVVHSAFLPGGRFLLTVQFDSSFACWDLEAPTRTRSVRQQTGLDTVIGEEVIEPHCVAYWKTGGSYVEFAHDVVEEGDAVIVALLVVDIVPDQLVPISSRILTIQMIPNPAPFFVEHSLETSTSFESTSPAPMLADDQGRHSPMNTCTICICSRPLSSPTRCLSVPLTRMPRATLD